MKIYARADNGYIVEIILPAVYDAEDPSWQEGEPSRIGQEIPIELRFHPIFVANMVEISQMVPRPEVGWGAVKNGDNWIITSPENEPPDLIALAAAARYERDRLLSEYDKGINMALRARRMADTPEQESYADGKIVELDNYAKSLEEIPEQAGFPLSINWPVMPAK